MKTEILFVIPLVFLSLFFLLLPVGYVIIRSFIDENGSFSLSNYVAILQTIYTRAIQNSLYVATITSIISLIIGSVLAYFISRFPVFYRELSLSIITLPLMYPGLVVAFSFVLTFGDNGMITNIMRLFGIELEQYFNLYSFDGLVAAYVYFEIPVVTLIMTSAILSFDKTLIEAARSLGASVMKALIYVVIPNIMPALLASVVLVYAMAIGAYGTALALLGGGANLLTLQIYSWISDVTYNQGLATALAVVALLLTIPLTILYRIISSRVGIKWI